MLAITKGLAPSVKGYVLMKDPKTLDELIECARTAQHVQPQQPNNADVAKMVSVIISNNYLNLNLELMLYSLTIPDTGPSHPGK